MAPSDGRLYCNAYQTLDGKLDSIDAFFGGNSTDCNLNDQVCRVTDWTFENTLNIPILALYGGDSNSDDEVARYLLGPYQVR